MAIFKASLRPYDQSASQDAFLFPLNPDTVSRSLVPAYADLPIAGADYGPNGSKYPPFQWVKNGPEEIRIHFLIDYSEQLTADADPNFVDRQLEILWRLMRKNPRTKEPVDLVFSMGPRTDIVRIFERTVEEKLWFDDLRLRQASVNLTMRTVFPRV